MLHIHEFDLGCIYVVRCRLGCRQTPRLGQPARAKGYKFIQNVYKIELSQVGDVGCM